MTTKSTKKKATKKTGKALAKQGRYNEGVGCGPVMPQHDVPLPDALKAFDDALMKVQDVRAILHHSGDEELKANRARRLADAAQVLQVAGWTLRESAYREADK